MAQATLMQSKPGAEPVVIQTNLKTVRGQGELQLGYIRIVTETATDEKWRYSMRPAKGQHLEYRDISSTEFEIRLVNDPGVEGVAAQEASGKPAKRTYTEMDSAELRTLIVERNLEDPGATARVGDMIKVLQNEDARLAREGKK